MYLSYSESLSFLTDIRQKATIRKKDTMKGFYGTNKMIDITSALENNNDNITDTTNTVPTTLTDHGRKNLPTTTTTRASPLGESQKDASEILNW